ncbi:adenylate/guanylate cyclase domain-containing protein [Aureimonas sp. AU12]|uniref:adenylate/guanylate cyclase domain-containing protein n=1 Tax=Aureimonas sp. AU12 TaxID=1638161 RepID=UPI0007852815|nr:adenylate/guanylate cyclase domain-containing protein [Aureimonas sp. AU12]
MSTPAPGAAAHPSAPAPPQDALLDWILREAMAGCELTALMAGIGEALVREGLALARLSLAMPAVDPTIRSQSVVWRRGQAARIETTDHGESAIALFERSPVFHLLETGLKESRWVLADREGVDNFALLADLAAQGCTDYRLTLLGFPAGTAISGAAVSVASDAAGGFAPQELARIDALLPALGLAAYAIAVVRSASEALRIYVGARPAERILAGEILRGTGHPIRAAILLADLRAFTALNEAHPAESIIGWLNEHFEVLGEAVAAEGGEILKFMGDSVLAIFPVEEGVGDADGPAAAAALRAAERALAGTAALNGRRGDLGHPAIAVDIVLHLGEVYYGNVGAARRLDFTVIGSAVNEAARIEALCDRLGRSLLLSERFVGACEGRFEALGEHPLRGVSRPHRIFGLALP